MFSHLKFVSAACFVAVAEFASAAEPVDVAFTSMLDKSQQHYVMILPDAFDSAAEHDVLFALHGHGSDRWQAVNGKNEHGEFTAAREVAAKRGMIYVSPDYRARTSWMNAAAESDMLQIIDELKHKYKVGRVFLSGGSMGASSSLTFAALHPELVSGVVAFNGLADHLTYGKLQGDITRSFGNDPMERKRRSALYYPEKFTMPVAFTFGGMDKSVPPDSGRLLAVAIRRFNNDVYVDDKPDRGHATDLEASRAAFAAMFRMADARVGDNAKK